MNNKIPSPNIDSGDYAVITESDGFYSVILVCDYTSVGTIHDLDTNEESKYNNIAEAINDVRNAGITDVRVSLRCN